MEYSSTKGRKRLNFTPYLTYVGPRKIGNVPARYHIRKPDSPATVSKNQIEDIEPPPVLKHYAEDDYEEPSTSAETGHFIEEEFYGTEDMVVDHEIIIEDYEEDQTPHKMKKRIFGEEKKIQKDLRYTYPTCYVEPNRRWTYKDQQQPAEDGLLYYVPNPFLPVPSTKGAPPAAIRMHYAANRIDSIKFRGQHNKVQETKECSMESANCEKCHMRFFLPFNHMRSHISYSETDNRFDLPAAHFRCPLCRHQNHIVEYNKEDY